MNLFHPGVAPQAGAGAVPNRPVAYWLLACCVLVFAMVVVGGVTRLTHSGLSITEWQPIVGTLPPLSEADWETAFAKYRQTPEYQQVNRGMGLEAFKGIFWWEYFHRLLGRLIGVAFLLPMLWFLLRGRLQKPLALRLAGIFLLGGLQGAMGWYMVMSGLVDNPRVSQFRLTAHLLLALLIYAAMFWTALDLLSPAPASSPGPARARLRRLASGALWLVALMIASGGFVAGIRAGFAFNTFPLMNGRLIPPDILLLDPWYMNFFSNMATVQFDHRLIAWMLAAYVPWLWWQVRREPSAMGLRSPASALLAALALQWGLGVSTLLLAVPVPLAAAHQGGAVLVLTCALWLRHGLRAIT